jgi:hypothetical protein
MLNARIRSDACNQLLMRIRMNQTDIELIRKVKLDDKWRAVQALKEKINRESVYSLHMLSPL